MYWNVSIVDNDILQFSDYGVGFGGDLLSEQNSFMFAIIILTAPSPQESKSRQQRNLAGKHYAERGQNICC